MTATVYVQATSTAPVTTCPNWCDRRETHLDDLAGRVIHSGADGSPDPDEELPILFIEGRRPRWRRPRRLLALLDLVEKLSPA